MDRLVGKVAVVTGCGRRDNIGLSVCQAFVAEGARAVVGTDVQIDDDLAAEMAVASDGRLRLIRHDATDGAAWEGLAAEVAGQHGGLDVLVNNAGISIHGGVLDTTLDQLHQVMAVNHDAVFLAIKACAPYLAETHTRHPGGGSVINTLSIGSFMPNAHNLGYHVSKAAARMLTMCAAKELGPQRIRVNSVHPGVTMTPLIATAMHDYVERGVWASMDEAERSLAGGSALGKVIPPDAIGSLYVYLASDESRYVTGAALVHDAGMCERY